MLEWPNRLVSKTMRGFLPHGGSNPSLAAIGGFNKMKNNKFPKINTITIPQNRGKGNALREAFKWAAENNYTHLITLDADGQHEPAEIPKFIKNFINPSQFFWILIYTLTLTTSGLLIYNYIFLKRKDMIHV